MLTSLASRTVEGVAWSLTGQQREKSPTAHQSATLIDMFWFNLTLSGGINMGRHSLNKLAALP